MTTFAQITIRLTDHCEEETMHLIDAEARKEKAFCGVEASACDLTSMQLSVRQLIDSVPVGNICRTCMACAACWAEGHCRRLVADAAMLRARAQGLHERDAKRHRNSVKESDLEADLLLEQAREHRRLADRLTGDARPAVHVWVCFA